MTTMRNLHKLALSCAALYCLLSPLSAFATAEEKLYHQLLALKEKRIDQLERDLKITMAKLNNLEQQTYGKSITPAHYTTSENQIELNEPYIEYQPTASSNVSMLNPPSRQVASSLPYSPTITAQPPRENQADWKWRGSVEALFLKPRFHDLAFAKVTGGNNILSTHEVDLDYDYGMKAEFETFVDQDWTFGAWLSFFNAEDSSSVSNAGIKPMPGFGIGDAGTTTYNSANAKAEFELWRSGLYYRRHYNHMPFAITLTPAIEFAHMELDQNYNYANATDQLTQTQKQRFIGAGPSLKTKGVYAFNPYFAVDASMGASLLFGEHETSFTGQQAGANPFSTAATTFKDYTLLPVLSADIGLNWQNIAQNGSGYSVRLAYSFENYLGLDRPMKSSTAQSTINTGVSGRDDRDITLDGVHLELSRYW